MKGSSLILSPTDGLGFKFGCLAFFQRGQLGLCLLYNLRRPLRIFRYSRLGVNLYFFLLFLLGSLLLGCCLFHPYSGF
jgi:hypothetical protein